MPPDEQSHGFKYTPKIMQPKGYLPKSAASIVAPLYMISYQKQGLPYLPLSSKIGVSILLTSEMN